MVYLPFVQSSSTRAPTTNYNLQKNYIKVHYGDQNELLNN